jgi:hypothetical protein
MFPYRLPGETLEWRETIVRTIAPVLFEPVQATPPAA